MKVLLRIVLVIAALGCAEYVVRCIGKRSPEGEFSLGGLVAKPYVLPWGRIQKNLTEYLESADSRVQYDDHLGWRAREGARSRDGLYQYSERGARAATAGEKFERVQNSCTVLLIGDSVTHGDEVSYDDSWGAQLEKRLAEQGVSTAVVNLGFSGYGMDQALLRLEREGAQYAPDLVLFGFQPENVKRNLSLSRVYYTHGADQIPFYKPRFILKDDGALELIGVPTVPPERVLSQLQDSTSFAWNRYESFYTPSDYEPRWWRESKLVGLVESFLTESNRYVFEARERRYYDLNAEPAQLAQKIIERIKEVSNVQGAQFGIVYLPFEYYLQQQVRNEKLVIQELLNQLQENYPFFNAATLFAHLSPSDQKTLYMHPHGYHLSPTGGRFLSEGLVPWLKKQLPAHCMVKNKQ